MSAEPVLRAGLIGAGWIGQRHAQTLAMRADVTVAAVCDVDADRAAQVARASGADVFADWRQMLETADLDTLWICTPPRAHADLAVAALDRGLPVYLEKPIARSLEDAAQIVAAATRGGAVCAVGYQWRAVDVLGELTSALAGRTVGCLVGQSIGGTESRPWFLSRAEGGGNLLERGSHHIDLARRLAGEVVAVQAAESAVRLAPRRSAPGFAAGGDDGRCRAASAHNGVDDIADAVTMLLHFESGGLGTIVVAWTSGNQPGSYWVELTAADASFRLDLDPHFRLAGLADGTRIEAVATGKPFEGSVDRFLTAAKAGDPTGVFCAPDDAARTLAVAVAAEEALRSGTTVRVPS